jgi:beta-barrel assembly-enhancing protease
MLRLCKVASALLLASLLFGCSVNPATGQRELILIPESQEIALGVQSTPQMEQEFGGRVANEPLQAYVNQVGKQVAKTSDRPNMPYEFMVVCSDTPNAFALPGGKIFITAGLFKCLTNERQLACTLGHEIGHVNAKHNVKGLQRQMGAEVLATLAGEAAGADKKQAAAAAAKLAGSMIVMKYSRDDEYEADLIGMRYGARAGYSPWGMVETLEVLQKIGGADPGKLAEMFQTHPLTGQRISQARAAAEKDYKQSPPAAADPGAARFMQMRGMLGK